MLECGHTAGAARVQRIGEMVGGSEQINIDEAQC